MTKKIVEHIVQFLITVLLTYLLSFIPFLNDTHKHLRYDLNIERSLNLMPEQTVIIYKIFNDGSLVLNPSNTIIEYNSNLNPVSVFFINPKGQEESIKPNTTTTEKFRLTIPKWLVNREIFDIVITYKGFSKIEDQLNVKYSKDGKFSTISAGSNLVGYSSRELANRVITYLWINYLLSFIILFIGVYQTRKLIKACISNYNKRLEEKFISKDNQFLTDEDEN